MLQVGDKIETAGGAVLAIARLTTYNAHLTAYNLEVADIHLLRRDYASPVHNDCGNSPAGGFAGAHIDEVAEATYQHVGAGEIPGRPSLSQIKDALVSGTPEALAQGDGSVAQVINCVGVRVISNETGPWRSTAFYKGT